MITKLTPDNFEFFTLVTTPRRTFASGSGIAGIKANINCAVTFSLTGTVGGPITESYAAGDLVLKLSQVPISFQRNTFSNTTTVLVPTGSVYTDNIVFEARDEGVMPVIIGPTGSGAAINIVRPPSPNDWVRVYATSINNFGRDEVDGVSGKVNVFPRRSRYEKEVQPLSLFSASLYNDENLDDIRKLAVNNTSSDISDSVTAYISAVSDQQESVRKQQRVEVIRFTPSFRFSSNTLRKNIVREILMPYYRPVYPRAQWTYGNYHCLNFFTSSTVPTDSALLFPNSSSVDINGDTGSAYQISGAFSFDFYIRPKYTTLSESIDYKAGTIMHLTGAYALSLHTGSNRDINGVPNGFRIALALSNSANIPPSQLTESDPFVFFSDDNALTKDDWQHVTIRWGGTNYNFGSGSILVDSVNKKNFTITSSIGVGFFELGEDPSVLVVGNYYEGENTGLRALDRFFATDTATREGLFEINSTAGVFAPSTSSFTHPLNAEVHDLKLYDKYLTLNEINELSSSGPTSLDNLKFYLPPFFTQESPFRQDVNNFGGVLYTPFFAVDGTTETPYAAEMAFGAGGHYVNLENYVRDFATGLFPRLWQLSGSAFEPPSTTVLSANDFLYQTGSVRRRLYTVLPCDNGQFLPNFDLLADLSGSRFVDDLGNKELGAITLNNIVPLSSGRASSTIFASGSILDDVLGAQPESGSITALPGDSLAVLHRTKDPSSNQVVFFDVSNLFYGNRIKPGSLTLSDTAISYSGGALGITIKDDGEGNLYRANASGSHATWNSVGNVFYDEGIIVLKHPNLYFFGETEFTVQLSGENNLHILTINAFARALREVTSSNPSYQPFTISDLAHDTDSKAVWITGINIHDDNLNIIARTNLAQPILKRSGDKMLFKVKLDF